MKNEARRHCRNDEWKKWYGALKATHPDEFANAIKFGEGVSITHNLPNKIAADIECALVMQACDLLGIRP